MLRYSQSEGSWPVSALFSPGNSVSIIAVDTTKNTQLNFPSSACTPIGTTGIFSFNLKTLTDTLDGFAVIHWKMSNGSIDKEGTVIVGGFADDISKSIIVTPFHVEIGNVPLIKGNSWEPEFRIDSNASNLKVTVEISDSFKTVKKATSTVDGGADDQVKLCAKVNQYQIFQLFLTAAESETFDSNFLNVKFTVETQDKSINKSFIKRVEFSDEGIMSFNTYP